MSKTLVNALAMVALLSAGHSVSALNILVAYWPGGVSHGQVRDELEGCDRAGVQRLRSLRSHQLVQAAGCVLGHCEQGFDCRHPQSVS